MPFKPLPAISETSLVSKSAPFFLYSIMAFAIGCVDCSSIAIKYFIISTSLNEPLLTTTFLILKTPLVTVPVLSITNVFILVIASKNEAPLNKIPFLEAAPNPPK